MHALYDVMYYMIIIIIIIIISIFFPPKIFYSTGQDFAGSHTGI